MGAESAAGFTRGLRVGLENVRNRRYRDAQLAMEEQEHNLRMESGQLGLERARRVNQEEIEDRPGEVQQRDYQRGRERVDDAFSDLQRSQGQEDRARQLARAGTLEGRADTQWDQGQEDRQRELDQVQNTMQNEGLREFVGVLRNGGDPSYAVRRFNRQGKLGIRPETFQYDPRSKRVKFTDSDGDEFDGTLDELAALAGEVPQDLVKLGKDDRLVDPRTGREVVGPKAGAGGEDDNRSPYNAQTEQREITNMIERQFAGINDPYGNYSVNEPDKARAAHLVSVATDMEGRLRDQVASGVLTRGEIVESVMDAWRDVPNDEELGKRAEAWRTDGLNKTPQQAAAWLEAERRRLYAAAQGKQATAERRLVEGAAKKQAADVEEADTLPEAARTAIQGLSEGETIEFRNGQVWSLQNGKPQRVK